MMARSALESDTMPLVKCTKPGCAVQAHTTGINPAYCATHLAAHYASGGLDAAWWTDQMEQDRMAWREATGPDGRSDLVLASLRSSIATRESSAEPISWNWFAAMTAVALDTIEVTPASATVTLSMALFGALRGHLVFGGSDYILSANGLCVDVNPGAMDSRLCYDDFDGERMVVVYPPINGLR
jgi:hypothetical protein